MNLKLRKKLAILLSFALIASTSIPAFGLDYDGHWAEQSIDTWSTNGVVQGYEDGTFRPNENVTRAELATFIVRVFGLTEKDEVTKYDDVAQDDWYINSVEIVTSMGIMNDYETSFAPNQFVTREETAFALANAYRLSGNTLQSFDDQDLVSDWTKDQMDAMIASGIINGKTPTTIAPQDVLTRAELVTMIDRLTAGYYSVAGTYTGDIHGSVVVNTEDVILKDMTIDGDLYIAEGVGNGDIILDNVTIKGNVFVDGGGENSIKFINGSSAITIDVNKADGSVRIFIDGDSQVEMVTALSNMKLDGDVGILQIKSDGIIEILSGTIDNIIVTEDADTPTLTLCEDVIVKEITCDAVVTVDGDGTIEKATVNVNDVVLSIEPKTLEAKEGIEVEIKESSPSSGSSSRTDSSKSVKPTYGRITESDLSIAKLVGKQSLDIEFDTSILNDWYEFISALNDSVSDYAWIPTINVQDNNLSLVFFITSAEDVPETLSLTIPKEIIQVNKDIIIDAPIALSTDQEIIDSIANYFYQDQQIYEDFHSTLYDAIIGSNPTFWNLGVNLEVIESSDESIISIGSSDQLINYPTEQTEVEVLLQFTYKEQSSSPVEVYLTLEPTDKNEPIVNEHMYFQENEITVADTIDRFVKLNVDSALIDPNLSSAELYGYLKDSINDAISDFADLYYYILLPHPDSRYDNLQFLMIIEDTNNIPDILSITLPKEMLTIDRDLVATTKFSPSTDEEIIDVLIRTHPIKLSTTFEPKEFNLMGYFDLMAPYNTSIEILNIDIQCTTPSDIYINDNYVVKIEDIREIVRFSIDYQVSINNTSRKSNRIIDIRPPARLFTPDGADITPEYLATGNEVHLGIGDINFSSRDCYSAEYLENMSDILTQSVKDYATITVEKRMMNSSEYVFVLAFDIVDETKIPDTLTLDLIAEPLFLTQDYTVTTPIIGDGEPTGSVDPIYPVDIDHILDTTLSGTTTPGVFTITVTTPRDLFVDSIDPTATPSTVFLGDNNVEVLFTTGSVIITTGSSITTPSTLTFEI